MTTNQLLRETQEQLAALHRQFEDEVTVLKAQIQDQASILKQQETDLALNSNYVSYLKKRNEELDFRVVSLETEIKTADRVNCDMKAKLDDTKAQLGRLMIVTPYDAATENPHDSLADDDAGDLSKGGPETSGQNQKARKEEKTLETSTNVPAARSSLPPLSEIRRLAKRSFHVKANGGRRGGYRAGGVPDRGSRFGRGNVAENQPSAAPSALKFIDAKADETPLIPLTTALQLQTTRSSTVPPTTATNSQASIGLPSTSIGSNSRILPAPPATEPVQYKSLAEKLAPPAERYPVQSRQPAFTALETQEKTHAEVPAMKSQSSNESAASILRRIRDARLNLTEEQKAKLAADRAASNTELAALKAKILAWDAAARSVEKGGTQGTKRRRDDE